MQKGGDTVKRRDLIKRLTAAGFRKLRDTGNHAIYKADGFPPISIPRHSEINENTAKTILRTARLL